MSTLNTKDKLVIGGLSSEAARIITNELAGVTTDPVTGGIIETASGTIIGGNNPVTRLKVAFARRPIGYPSIASSTPTISQATSNNAPQTATVRVIPWLAAVGGKNPNNWLNSPYLWTYAASEMLNSNPSLLYLWNLGMNSGEQFTYVEQAFPSNSNQVGPLSTHFLFDGQSFELLTARNWGFVLAVGDQVVTSVAGVSPGANSNAWTKIDFGSRALRRISIYTNSLPASIAVSANDTIAPWDRSNDISMVANTDSYGSAPSTAWSTAGGFSQEMFFQCGFANYYSSARGGTGYYNNNGGVLNSISSFAEMSIPNNVDLFLTSLGINETPATIGYATYNATVLQYYQLLRVRYPYSVLVSTNAWSPLESDALLAKRTDVGAAVLSALQSVGGPFVFVNNLNGTWLNSRGISGVHGAASTSSTTTTAGGPSINSGGQTPIQSGTWQTGNGKVTGTTGKGNGDLYVQSDGTHPTAAGSQYLGRMLALATRAGVLAL